VRPADSTSVDADEVVSTSAVGDQSRLRVSRDSVPVVPRRRLAVRKTVIAAAKRMMTMAMAMGTECSCSYSSKKMPSFHGKTKLNP
jgi:hypothetical protein